MSIPLASQGPGYMNQQLLAITAAATHDHPEAQYGYLVIYIPFVSAGALNFSTPSFLDYHYSAILSHPNPFIYFTPSTIHLCPSFRVCVVYSMIRTSLASILYSVRASPAGPHDVFSSTCFFFFYLTLVIVQLGMVSRLSISMHSEIATN